MANLVFNITGYLNEKLIEHVSIFIIYTSLG